MNESTFFVSHTQVSLKHNDRTGWKAIGWAVTSTGYVGGNPTTIRLDGNIKVRPFFEIYSPPNNIVDLGTFIYALEKSTPGTYTDLSPVSGTPAGEFSRTFSDYGDVTIALKNGKMTVEGLANATGTVYFPDLEYESGGTRYRASFIFYIVSDVSPADGLFTLIRETKTTSLGS